MTTTSTALQIFQFDNVATGTSLSLNAMQKNGQAWFIAKDICAALDIKNSRDALAALDDDEKGVAFTDTLGGRQRVATVNESGLYALIIRSNRPLAKALRKWVTATVIPSIRKHGGYINGQEALAPDEQKETIQVINQEARRVGLVCSEEKEARSEALRLMGRTRSYGPGGNPRRKIKGKR